MSLASQLVQRPGCLCNYHRPAAVYSGSRQRSPVLCRARRAEDPSGRPLFQLDDRQSLNMADIMDAYEVCSLIPDPNERHQCYSVFGLDAQRMANYYETVVRLEQQLSADIDTSVASSRWPHLWQQQHPQQQFHMPSLPFTTWGGSGHSQSAITGSSPPPPAAAAALALSMLLMASKHLAWF